MATPVASENDWKVNNVWLMNQNEPLGASDKRVRWSLAPDAIVQIGFPERVPGTGPSYTAPFKVSDVFGPPVAGGTMVEPQLVFPTSQRNLEWWMFTP